MEGAQQRYARAWGTGLIVVGVVLLGVVAFVAFSIVRDPGGYYDEWVPGEETEGPEASFDWASSGLDVEFTDASTAGEGTVERWEWDFGDGAESGDRNPSHRYASAGEWDVTLEVVDANGLTSTAEGTVAVEPGASGSGEGTLGLTELADTVVDTVERAAKGGLVVLLVIGMLVVLTMVGGRLVRQGVRIMRPLPDRISLKLRPKELEVAVLEPEPAAEAAGGSPAPSGATSMQPELEEAEERVEAGV